MTRRLRPDPAVVRRVQHALLLIGAVLLLAAGTVWLVATQVPTPAGW